MIAPVDTTPMVHPHPPPPPPPHSSSSLNQLTVEGRGIITDLDEIGGTPTYLSKVRVSD